MNRLAVLVILLLAGGTFGQELTIKGDTKIVQIDKIVVTKEDRLLVQSLPFSISAPPGAFDYRWSFPSGVTVLDMGDTLKVTGAPRGECTVGVVIKTIDFDKKKVDSKFQTITFLIGDVPTPIPPAPIDAFSKAVQDAFTLESDLKKAANIVQLAALYKAADTTVDDPTLKTFGDLLKRMHTAADSLIGSSALPKVRRVIANELNTALGTNPAAVLDAAERAIVKDEFHRIAATLGGIK